MAEDITITEIEHVAWLARLQLSPDEVQRFRRELGTILTYMHLLDAIDTTGVEILPGLRQPVPFRDDIVQTSQKRALALMNAPQVRHGAIVVPAVIGTDHA